MRALRQCVVWWTAGVDAIACQGQLVKYQVCDERVTSLTPPPSPSGARWLVLAKGMAAGKLCQQFHWSYNKWRTWVSKRAPIPVSVI